MTRVRETANRLWPWLAAIASGLLGSACFPPFEQTWLVWIALTPLLAAVWFSGKNSRRRWLWNAALGYVAGIVFFTVSFGWLGALGDLFESFWLHGLPFLLALYLGVYFAFWSCLLGMIRPASFMTSWRNLLAAVLAASAWVALEWIRGWLSGFGWNGLGASLYAQWPLIQIAEFTGVAGLSFVIALANVIAVTTPVRLFLEARTHRMRPHWDVNLTMVAIIGLLVFGWRVAQSPAPARPMRVAAVQANVPQPEKFNRQQFAANIFDRFTRLSGIALKTNPPPDLLIWPESSTPGPVLEDEASNRFVMDFSAAARTDLLLGTIEQENEQVYNAALLVSGADQSAQIYRKIHLVPFGEYIPLRHSFPLFAAAAGGWVTGDFDAGKDYTVFRLTNGNVQAAPLICFEDTVGELVRQFVRQGADLLVNITNDGWFLQSAGSKQHMANAIFRCVETRRPMVRAANTGVTCFVNEFGRVTQVLQDETGSTFTEGVLAGAVDIPLDRHLTFYAKHGELFAKICACITLFSLIIAMVRSRRANESWKERAAD